MQGIGWLMVALFVWLFHGPWLKFKRAADAQDWPAAGGTAQRIRQIIMVNLPLGLIVVVIGGTGRYLGLKPYDLKSSGCIRRLPDACAARRRPP